MISPIKRTDLKGPTSDSKRPLDVSEKPTIPQKAHTCPKNVVYLRGFRPDLALLSLFSWDISWQANLFQVSTLVDKTALPKKLTSCQK